jgi:hypothetical protein
MDTLITLVLLVTIATNSRKASVFYRAVPVFYGEATESTSQLVLVSRPPKLVFVS